MKFISKRYWYAKPFTHYKLWEEKNKFPDFVLEITSRKTQENDEMEKQIKYAKLGVQEYFQYDPTGDYLMLIK